MLAKRGRIPRFKPFAKQTMMHSNTASVIAAAGPLLGQAGQSTMPPWAQLVPFLLIIGVFYFILVLPQQRKAKEHTQLLKSLKAGDKIVTSGGVIGVVITVKDRSVSIRSADAKLEILKSSVSEITERASGANGA